MEGYVLIQQPSNITTPATLIKNKETKMTSLIITKFASQMFSVSLSFCPKPIASWVKKFSPEFNFNPQWLYISVGG